MIIETTISRFLDLMDVSLDQAEAMLSGTIGDCLYSQTKGRKGQALEELYFSAIACRKRCESILEIGTGIGVHTNILARLFHDSSVFTIDIEESDPLAIRTGNLNDFNRNISLPNIEYQEVNSFFLRPKGKFDLIWVDGGHQYPSVSWDIQLSYSYLSSGGIMLIHDYNRENSDVKKVVECVSRLIEEDVYLLPFADYDPKARTCLIIKK